MTNKPLSALRVARCASLEGGNEGVTEALEAQCFALEADVLQMAAKGLGGCIGEAACLMLRDAGEEKVDAGGHVVQKAPVDQRVMDGDGPDTGLLLSCLQPKLWAEVDVVQAVMVPNMRLVELAQFIEPGACIKT